MDAVLIPAYEPDAQLILLTERLREAGFAVVVVDDGSGEGYKDIFAAVKENGATVLTHPQNGGKGAALKTGMAYIRDHMPEIPHFITCDADGQHKVEDVIRVSQQLGEGHKFVLTMRKQKKDIPLRSKVGNALSRVVYALLTGRYLSDNQSGLRGFCRSHIDWMVKVEKNNYDYEMNVLYYAAKKGIRIATIPIEAIYIDNNQSSHFKPVTDTVRIYRSLFKLAIGQFIGFGVAQLWIAAATLIFGYEHLLITVPGAGAVSYLVNVITDKYFMFRNTHCYDYLTRLIYKVIYYFIYTMGCMLFMYGSPEVPLWVAFNITFIAYIPLRYWLHKFMFIAQRTHE